MSIFTAFGRYVFGTLGNEANFSYSIIQSVVAFSQTPKHMTLNDLEILNGHFTLNFHYYEPRFSIVDCRVCLHTQVTNEDVRKPSSGP